MPGVLAAVFSSVPSVSRSAFGCAKHRFQDKPNGTPCRHVAMKAERNPTDQVSTSTMSPSTEKSEADRIVDGMTFAELCNEFQCVSSPAVEATARQIARDILEIRDGTRALGTFAVAVKYKDPLRAFTGRDKYKRTSWAKVALEEPSVAVRQMEMLSTSVLSVQWTLYGKAKIPIGDLIVEIDSKFTLNQISGQVLEHQENWDLSRSSLLARTYFWSSRLSYSALESTKDTLESLQSLSQFLNKDKSETDYSLYADPTDPRKFFEVDNNPLRDVYQIGFFIALLYLLVQFLRLTL